MASVLWMSNGDCKIYDFYVLWKMLYKKCMLNYLSLVLSSLTLLFLLAYDWNGSERHVSTVHIDTIQKHLRKVYKRNLKIRGNFVMNLTRLYLRCNCVVGNRLFNGLCFNFYLLTVNI